MDKLSERIGLYDLWVTFFPGSIGVLGALLFLGMNACIYSDKLSIDLLVEYLPKEISDWFLFVIVSILCGIIIQEIGHFIHKKAKLKDASAAMFDQKQGVFSESEIKFLNLQKYDTNSKIVFHQINTRAQAYGIAPRYIKLNVIQNMSLSLAADMIIWNLIGIVLTVVSIGHACANKIILLIVLYTICSFLLCIMFLKRSERYNRYWVRNIVYAVVLYERGINVEDKKKANL